MNLSGSFIEQVWKTNEMTLRASRPGTPDKTGTVFEQVWQGRCHRKDIEVSVPVLLQRLNRFRWRLLCAPILWSAGLIASNASATDYPVTVTADSGAGSERVAVQNAIVDGDRLVFASGLNGQTLLSSSSLTISHAITLLDSNSITLSDSHAYTLAKPLTIDWAGTLNMTNVLSDGVTSGSLIKSGLGSLVLSGANSYSGGTTIQGGTLSLLNNNALGTGIWSVCERRK